MISSIISRIVILLFGTLYPAYASYKAVRTKNVKEYVKWMMYWIVFALFTCAETFTDVFLSWFPFYYEVKILMVIWLLSPATKGSSILYRKFVHPALCRREQEIDEYISKAKDQGYHTVLNLGTKGVNYATNVIMQTAIKNFSSLESARKLQLASPRAPLSSVAHIRELTPDVTFVDHVDAPIEISSEESEISLLLNPKIERESPPLEDTHLLRNRKNVAKRKTAGTKRARSGTRRSRKRSVEKHTDNLRDLSTE